MHSRLILFGKAASYTGLAIAHAGHHTVVVLHVVLALLIISEVWGQEPPQGGGQSE